MNETVEDIDRAIQAIRADVYDAEIVNVGRDFHVAIDSAPQWRAWVSVPRRSKTFKIVRGRAETVSGRGDTLADAVQQVCRAAYFQRTGKLPPDPTELELSLARAR